MSGAAAPWSVKGIEPKTREVAKDLARRSGMTLGEWLSEMIAESDEDESCTPLSQRTTLRDIGRPRGRRLDDGYGETAPVSTLGAIEALSARIEAAERRSSLAIEGVDKAVGGILRRIEALQDESADRDRRLDNVAEELREGRTRLRQVETDLGPKVGESIGKIEQSVAKLGGQLFDSEAKARDGAAVLRDRMDKFEREHSAERLIDTAAARVAARLEDAQSRTAQSLARLELSFADLDRRMNAAERTGGRETGALERLAESLSRKVEESRSELLRRFESITADPRVDRLDRTFNELTNHVQASERRSVEAIETMGREVLRIAENLNGRVGQAEAAQAESEARALKAVEVMGAEIGRTVSADLARVTDTIDQRQRRADDQHALALERLGDEIARISERLSERIGQGERRAQQSVEELGERVTRASEKMEVRYDRASGELGERMRQSEERTAALLAEARESIDRQLNKRAATADFASDWRDGGFPQADYGQAEFTGDWGAPARPVDPAFPADPVFVDAPSLIEETAAEAELEAPFAEPTLDDDVFEPATARTAYETAFEPPVFGAAEPVEAADVEIDDGEIEPVEALAEDDEPQAEVAIEPLTAFEPAAAFEPAYQDGDQPDLDVFEAETAFVDPRTASAPQRPMSTREALAAARASAAGEGYVLEEEKPRRGGFGFMGGKSRLQKRMEKQTKSDSTLRKALVATTTAVVVVGGGVAGVLGYQRLVAEGSAIPAASGQQGDLMAAAAVAPTRPEIAPPAPEAEARGRVLYDQASDLIARGDAEGVRIMSQAANLGYPRAQFALAKLYETGDAGVTVDLTEARRWTERAARGGEPLAMHNLAMFLYEGSGGARDQAGALQWFEAAAERGLPDSQYNLARIYEQGGEGVTADPVRAYQWYLVAAREGDLEAQASATRVGDTLSAAQRIQAETQAERFEVEPATVQG